MNIQLIRLSITSFYIYVFFSSLWYLDGVGVEKILIYSFLILSLAFMVAAILRGEFKFQIYVSKWHFYLILSILVWNLFLTSYSLIQNPSELFTIFGNPFCGPALLTPVAVFIGFTIFNIADINSFLLKIVLIGIGIFLIEISYFEYKGISQQFLMPVFFLFMLIPYQKRYSAITIIIGVIIICLSSIYLDGIRTMIIRNLLTLFGLGILYIYEQLKLKLILVLSFLSISIPIIFIFNSIQTNESPFKIISNELKLKGDIADDTRYFLYQELVADLITTNTLIIGKGAIGKYHSNYFRYAAGDVSERLSMEVGVLALLLKGGVISVVLNLSILIIAIYFSLFKSNNIFSKRIGFILLIHLFLLFIRSVPSYDIYNILIWICVGASLSKNVRHIENNEFKSYLNNV